MKSTIPLAERLRPSTLDDYIGQKHLIGENAVLRRAIESGRVPSMIFWGPPGVGKTTLAYIISKQVKRQFFQLSAVSSGVKEVREVIDRARMARGANIVYRRDTPFQQIATGLAVGCRGKGTRHIDRCHDGESFFRGHLTVAVTLSGLCDESPRESRLGGNARQSSEGIGI